MLPFCTQLVPSRWFVFHYLVAQLFVILVCSQEAMEKSLRQPVAMVTLVYMTSVLAQTVSFIFKRVHFLCINKFN